MVIKSITQDTERYVVGENDIASIETTDQGPKRLYMYQITYTGGRLLFVGLLEKPEIEYMEG